MATAIQDVRHAIRALLKQRSYLVTGVLTLALGIGFTTATFSVVNGVILRPLPYQDPDRLVRLIERNLPRFPEFSVSPGHYLFWRANNASFEGVALWAVQTASFETGAEEPQRVRADRVSANLFSLLGVAPLSGRAFEETDDAPNAPKVAIVSHAAWQRRLGGAPDVIGRTIRLDRRSVTVVGVMPPWFRFPYPETELWVPLALSDTERKTFGSHSMHAIARLRPGVTLDQARSDMAGVSRRLAEVNPASAGWEVLLFNLHDYAVRDVRESLLVLFGAVSLVLLIACANVANLLLVRGSARQKELAIRSSIGATRGRLLRQLFIEQFVLASISAAAGVLVAAWMLRVLLAMLPGALPAHTRIELDGAVLLFAVALAAGTPLLFGLIPALQATRPDLRTLLASGGRQATAVPARRVRTTLVVSEIALAMMLLIGATLLVRSFLNLAHESPGFVAEGAVLAPVVLPTDKYQQGEPRERFMNDFLHRVRALPDVSAAALSVPMAMVNDFNSPYDIDGDPQSAANPLVTLFYAVSSEFFEVMQTPLLRGRVITDEDRRGGRRVVLVNQTLAERHFAGSDPIGRRIRVGQGDSEWREIVGVVGNVKQTGLDERPRAQVYESYLQHPYFANFSLLVRSTAANPTAVIPHVRAILHEMDPELPLGRVRTLTEIIDGSVRPQRFSTALIGTFGGAALLLAAIGLYGVIAYTVGLRRHEFAIRIAHGAKSSDILRLVMSGAGRMAAAGIALGAAAAVLLRSLIEGLLFNVSTSDPLTYLVVAGVLAATALTASAIPALRAVRVDPAVVLRGE